MAETGSSPQVGNTGASSSPVQDATATQVQQEELKKRLAEESN